LSGLADRLLPGVAPRARWALLAVMLALVAAPHVVSSYILSLLIVCLIFAFLGQAWNLMMGFAGLLSLGHALYTGLGAYTAAALYANLGVNGWIGLAAGVALAVLAAAIIGFLGFRFSIEGVYFALLTIAFAEFTRVGFNHIEWTKANAGLFLPNVERESSNLATLRGLPVMFYYIMLAFTFGTLALCHRLLRSRLGQYWIAIREDPVAAQALGIDVLRYRMYAVMLSAGLSAAGGAVYAFYNNNLFPDNAFALHFSIELTLAPIVGGVGTLVGPILGAFILTPLGEALTALTDELQLSGIKQFFYGLCLIVIVVARPAGVWPWLCKRLGFTSPPERDQ
jgi:branched-chain amino acid transport system permease protein